MFLSIIIPVYNGEKFIEECLNSCLEQDMPKDLYEIICINDGSTDKSEKILNNYNEKYSNVSVLSQNQGGVGKARNRGLELAHGDYVWFIDADDFIDENILKEISTIIVDYNPDRIKVLSYCFHNCLSKSELDLKKKHLLQSNYPCKDTLITRTIIRREYIIKHKISFYEQMAYGEDSLFNFETRLYSPNDYAFEHVSYFYRFHEDSATSVNSEKKRKKYICSCEEAIRIVSQYYNKRVNLRTTKPVLVYWINMMLEQYYYFGSLGNSFSWDASLLNIFFIDFKLKKLNKLCDNIYNNQDFSVLENYVVSYLKAKEIKRKRKQKRKALLGYLKHPKRLFKILK